jgi:hypothetical protein
MIVHEMNQDATHTAEGKNAHAIENTEEKVPILEQIFGAATYH